MFSVPGSGPAAPARRSRSSSLASGFSFQQLQQFQQFQQNQPPLEQLIQLQRIFPEPHSKPGDDHHFHDVPPDHIVALQVAAVPDQATVLSPSLYNDNHQSQNHDREACPSPSGPEDGEMIDGRNAQRQEPQPRHRQQHDADSDSLERGRRLPVHPALQPSEPRVISILLETPVVANQRQALRRGVSNCPVDDLKDPPFIRRCFPWSRFDSFITLVTVVQLVLFVITMIVGETMYDGAFVDANPMGGPSAETLRYMGGIYEPSIREGHLYLLITPLFLHAGVLHLLFNLYFQARMGYGLEMRFGVRGLVYIYFHTGLCAVLTSAIEKDDVISVGSSGALFGLMGADLSFVLYNKAEVMFWRLECLAIASIIVINMLMGLFPGVDNFAHLGGLMSGLPLGIAVAPMIEPKANAAIWRLLCWIVAYAMLTSLVAVFVSVDLPDED